MLTHCQVIASIDLHPDTFQPRNGTQTSVLILQKKTEDDINREAFEGIRDYEIFMAQVNAIGHDKRGNKVYKRNEDGEELLAPAESEITPLLERTASGDATVRALPRRKILDDDTPVLADEFLDWKKQVVLGW
jgi:type I restriction enzyme M protein